MILIRKNRLLVFVITCVLMDSCKASKLKSYDNTVFNVENKGVAGNTSVNLLSRLQTDVISQNPDLVVLMVGTNDMLNSKKFVSYYDYRINLNQIVKKIKKNKAQVLLMSSPTVDSIYLFNRHDKTLFTDSPNVKLLKAKQIVEDIAKENNTLFVDINTAFKTKNLPIHNQDNYIINKKNSNKEDGVHLTALGYKFIAENIYQYLKENSLLGKYKSIICFGDSLTKGSGAKGAGTITGENYPSFLLKMLTKNNN